MRVKGLGQTAMSARESGLLSQAEVRTAERPIHNAFGIDSTGEFSARAIVATSVGRVSARPTQSDSSDRPMRHAWPMIVRQLHG